MASTDSAAPAVEEQDQKNVAGRVASLPLVSSAYDMVSSAYTSTKESHPYVKSVCDVAEKGVKTITSAAVSGAQPILNKLEPQISAANEYACKGLDKLEEKLPILQQPTDKIISGAKDAISGTVTGAKDIVTNTVTGMMDKTMEAVHGGVEMTRTAVTSGVNTVMGSPVGQMVANSMGAVLGMSEELVDQYLPMTDDELAKLATSVEGFEMATVEEQKEQQSYFVRLGSLSTKLRQRAFQHSLGKLKTAKERTQDALINLQQTIELIENVKEGVDQKIQSGQDKLHQLWLQWRREHGPEIRQTEVPSTEQIETQALEVSHGLAQQLQSASTALVSNLQGLPASIQEKVVQVRQNVEEVRTAFMSAKSIQELSTSILAQSRDKVIRAKELTDELVDNVVQSNPVSWLVGPFTPSVKPEEEQIEMN